MSKKNHVKGGKVCKSHTTFITAAERVVKFLKKSQLVEKFSLGKISQAKSKNQRIKIQEVNGGLKLTVYGNKTFQEIFVYTQACKKLQKSLEEFSIQ